MLFVSLLADGITILFQSWFSLENLTLALNLINLCSSKSNEVSSIISFQANRKSSLFLLFWTIWSTILPESLNFSKNNLLFWSELVFSTDPRIDFFRWFWLYTNLSICRIWCVNQYFDLWTWDLTFKHRFPTLPAIEYLEKFQRFHKKISWDRLEKNLRFSTYFLSHYTGFWFLRDFYTLKLEFH